MRATKYGRSPMLWSSGMWRNCKPPVAGFQPLGPVCSGQPLRPVRSSCEPRTSPGKMSKASMATGMVADTVSGSGMHCIASVDAKTST